MPKTNNGKSINNYVWKYYNNGIKTWMQAHVESKGRQVTKGNIKNLLNKTKGR